MILVEVFLYRSSLKRLLELGNGIREVEYYDELAGHLEKCFIIDYQSGEVYSSKFEVISKPSHTSNIFWSIKSAFKVARELRSCREKIIVRSKQNLGAWTAYFAAKLLGSSYILRMGYSYAQSKQHESSLGSLLYPVLFAYELIMTRLAGHVIVSSEYLARKFFLTNYSVIRNSIDSRFTRAKSDTKAYRWISVGRIIKMKGSDKLSLFAKSRNDGVIIGNNPDDLPLGKNDYFRRLDNIEVANYFGSSMYYISFSNTEGNPKTLMEAIFAGCVPILSSIPAHIDVINELGYGYVVSDIESAHYIVNNYTSNLIETNYLKFIKRWSTENVVKKELEVLSKCVE